MSEHPRHRAICPTCGRGRLSPVLETRTFRIGAVSVRVPGVLLEACDRCSEKVIDLAEARRAKEIAKMLAARKNAA